MMPTVSSGATSCEKVGITTTPSFHWRRQGYLLNREMPATRKNIPLQPRILFKVVVKTEPTKPVTP